MGQQVDRDRQFLEGGNVPTGIGMMDASQPTVGLTDLAGSRPARHPEEGASVIGGGDQDRLLVRVRVERVKGIEPS